MSVARRLLLSILVALALFAGIQALAVDRLVLSDFLELETVEAREDAQRVREALEQEAETLAQTTLDWAAWSDTYGFMGDGNAEFSMTNLEHPGTYSNAGLCAMFLVDTEGQVVWARAYGSEGREVPPPPELAGTQWPSGHPMLLHTEQMGLVTGVLPCQHGAMLIAARPITDETRTSPPRGTLVMGRRLSAERLSEIRQRCRIPFRVHPLSDPLPPDAPKRDALPAADAIALSERDENHLVGWSTLHQPGGAPFAIVEVPVDREISRGGKRALRLVHLATLAAGLLVGTILLWHLGRHVMGPLRQVTEHATRVGRSQDLSTRLGLHRRDEIGRLGRAIDEMVDHLSESRIALADTARRAGASELASSLLHNVGNLLTSLQAAQQRALALLDDSHLDRLGKVVASLSRQTDTDAEAKRKAVGHYLAELNAHEEELHVRMHEELASIGKNLRSAGEIVAAQRGVAGSVDLRASESGEALLREAVAAVRPAFEASRIELTTQDYGGLPRWSCDRTRILQVLVNVLTNARQAVEEASGHGFGVRVSASPTQDGGFTRVTIEDSGLGFEPERASSLLEPGVTTKARGTGIGLHYCALTLQDHGGTFAISSEGQGLGAKVELTLPCETPVEDFAS